MRFAYADPPYPGQSAKHYRDHPDYAGEVDHAALIDHLQTFDGWVLHTSSPALRYVLPLCPDDARVMAWTKGFAAFKKNVPVAYAWEPVIVKAIRKPVVKPGMVYRDWTTASIALKRGLVGAKPASVCEWVFGVSGLEPDDEFFDLFPGSGAVQRAWENWKQLRWLFEVARADE